MGILILVLIVIVWFIISHIKKKYLRTLESEERIILMHLLAKKQISQVNMKDDDEVELVLKKQRTLIHNKLELKYINSRHSISPEYEFIYRGKINFSVLVQIIRYELVNIIAIIGLILLFNQFIEHTNNTATDHLISILNGHIKGSYWLSGSEIEIVLLKRTILINGLLTTMVLIGIYFFVFFFTTRQEKELYKKIWEDDTLNLDPITRNNLKEFNGSSIMIVLGKIFMIASSGAIAWFVQFYIFIK